MSEDNNENKEVEQDPEAAARAAARAERDKARAERAAERARKKAEEEAGEEAEPSHNQPLLDRYVQLIKDQVSPEAIDEAYINRLDEHRPTIVIHNAHWLATAQLLKDHEQTRQNYLRNLSGVDMETHLEVVYHFISFYTKEVICIKVKADRDNASIQSITPIFETANWNEREVYDLLGIHFEGHPNLTRIMMPDDWVGHPLRKDYEPYDPEV